MPHWSNAEGPLCGPWGVLPACLCFLGLKVLRPASSSAGSLMPCVSAVSQHVRVCVCAHARTHRCVVESHAYCLVTAPLAPTQSSGSYVEHPGDIRGQSLGIWATTPPPPHTKLCLRNGSLPAAMPSARSLLLHYQPWVSSAPLKQTLLLLMFTCPMLATFDPAVKNRSWALGTFWASPNHTKVPYTGYGVDDHVREKVTV